LLGDDWRYYITVTNPAAEAAGIPNDGAMVVDLKTYKATGLFLSNGVKEYVKWLNHMNDIGLLDPESFIQKYDQYTAKISTGRVLGTIDASWEIADSQRALRDAKMDNRTYGQYPCVIKAGLKNADLADPGFSPSGGIGITTSCKDPVRAIKYIDYLCSEEGQILRSWGIEGKNYTIQNGKRVISASELKKRNTDSDYFKKSGVSVYGYPFPSHGPGIKDSTGQYFQPNFPETIADGYSSAEKDVLKHYGVKLWSDLYPQSSQLPERKWGAGWTITAPADSKYLLITTKIDNLEKQVIPQAIMCKPSQFEAIWSKFVKDQEKMGIHDAEKDFEKYLKQRIELWYNK
jgi:putative aldouronate transport system substrate-binding protein